MIPIPSTECSGTKARVTSAEPPSITTDGTHFDAASMITFGEKLGYALRPDRALLDFEQPLYSNGPLDRQDECSATLGAASALQVVSTATQGDYTGGQAIGHLGSAGAFSYNRRNLLPLAGARSLQADFIPGDTGFDDEANADSSLLVAGWGADAGGDGRFSDREAAIGLGLDPTGVFRIQIEAQSYLTTPFTYQKDRWYRLILTWSESSFFKFIFGFATADLWGGIRNRQLFSPAHPTGDTLPGRMVARPDSMESGLRHPFRGASEFQLPDHR